MALTNGMKFFSIALTLVLLTSCNREDPYDRIFLRVENNKDYSGGGIKLEPLSSTQSLDISDIPEYTFYDENYKLIKWAKLEDFVFGDYYKVYIRNGKIHGTAREYNLGPTHQLFATNNRELDAENLQLISEYCFHYGIMHGKYRKYEDGYLIEAGQYYYGHQIGKEKKYYTSGALRGIAQYKHGQKVTEKTYHYNGKLNSQVQYDHDGREIHSEKYNDNGLLVEEHSIKDGAQITRVYDFEAKNYKTYQEDDNGNFKGSYYSTFDDEGDFEFAIDISKLKAGIILLKYPNKSIQCKVANGALASAIIEFGGRDKYIHDDKLTSVKRYIGNKLVGIYIPKTKEVRGEIDYNLVDNLPIPIYDEFEQCIRDLVKDYNENKLSESDLKNLEDIYGF